MIRITEGQVKTKRIDGLGYRRKQITFKDDWKNDSVNEELAVEKSVRNIVSESE